MLSQTPPHSHHVRGVQIIEYRSVFPTLTVGDLVGTEGHQAPDLVSGTHPGDDPVQTVGERRRGHLQYGGRCLLRHDLAERTDPKLQAIGDASIRGRPWDFLLHEPMGRAEDLLGGIPEQSLATQDRYVLPGSGLLGLAHDGAAALTVRTAAAVFEGLDPEMEFRIALFK